MSTHRRTPQLGGTWRRYRACPLPDACGRALGEQVELFLSTYVNKVDRKGRVSVPATFRSALASNRNPNLVILFPSFRVPAIDGAGSDRMVEIQNRLERVEPFSEEYENLTQLFADSFALAIDGEGRIVLPDSLKEHARITSEVSFVGLGAMFQIWQPSLYEEHRAAVRERFRRQGTTLPASAGAARRPDERGRTSEPSGANGAGGTGKRARLLASWRVTADPGLRASPGPPQPPRHVAAADPGLHAPAGPPQPGRRGEAA